MWEAKKKRKAASKKHEQGTRPNCALRKKDHKGTADPPDNLVHPTERRKKTGRGSFTEGTSREKPGISVGKGQGPSRKGYPPHSTKKRGREKKETRGGAVLTQKRHGVPITQGPQAPRY